MNEPWRLKGDFVLSCSCTVFCPCVISLGQHAPTEGYCQTWFGIGIKEGHYGDVDISGLNVGVIAEIPGLMVRGNWTVDTFGGTSGTAASTRILPCASAFISAIVVS